MLTNYLPQNHASLIYSTVEKNGFCKKNWSILLLYISWEKSISAQLNCLTNAAAQMHHVRFYMQMCAAITENVSTNAGNGTGEVSTPMI